MFKKILFVAFLITAINITLAEVQTDAEQTISGPLSKNADSYKRFLKIHDLLDVNGSPEELHSLILAKDTSMMDKRSAEYLLTIFYLGEYNQFVVQDGIRAEQFYKLGLALAKNNQLSNTDLLKYKMNKYIGFLNRENYPKALNYYLMAEKHCLALNSKYAYVDFLLIYIDFDCYHKVDKDLIRDKKEKLEKLIPNSELYIQSSYQRLYYTLGKYATNLDSGLVYLDKALGTFKTNNNAYYKNIDLQKVSLCLNFKEYIKALRLLTIFEETLNEKHNSIFNIRILELKAGIYFGLKKYDKAKKYFDLYYYKFKGGDQRPTEHLIDLGYQIYKHAKDYEKMNFFLEKKIHHVEKNYHLALDSVKYAHTKSANDYLFKIDVVEKKNEYQKQRFYLIGIVLVLVFIIFLIYHFQVRRNLAKEAKLNDMTQKALREELKYSKLQQKIEYINNYIKFPVFNTKVLIDSLLNEYSKLDKASRDILLIIHSNISKIMGSTTNITASLRNSSISDVKLGYSQQKIGANFVDQLKQQFQIFVSPKKSIVELQHIFLKDSYFEFKDANIEFILFDVIFKLSSFIDTHAQIKVVVQSKDDHSLQFLITSKCSFCENIEQEFNSIMNSGHSDCSIVYLEDTNEFSINIDTPVQSKNLSKTLITEVIKPTELTPVLFDDKSIILYSSNNIVSDIFINSTGKDLVKDPKTILDAQNPGEPFDLVVFYANSVLETHYLLEFLKKSNRQEPILVLDNSFDLTGQLSKEKLYSKVYILEQLSSLMLIKTILEIFSPEGIESKKINSIVHGYEDELVVNKMINLVLKNISKTDYLLKDLALDMHYSERHLQRLIKQKTGMSISKLILEIKLKKAFNTLIENPNLRVQEVQYMIGIKSASYFNKSFKERFGFPPGQLNKNMP
jgi:AraC-like DNA-binding protein